MNGNEKMQTINNVIIPSTKQKNKQSKIIDKLMQIQQQYEEQQQKLIINDQILLSQDQEIKCENQSNKDISKNKLQQQQRNKLIVECNNISDVFFTQLKLELSPETMLKFVKIFDLLLTSNTKDITIDGENIQLIDIKVKVCNEQEDYLFASHKLVHNTFRRGLCLVFEDNTYRILRRGMKKFFDLQPLYLMSNFQFSNSFPENSFRNTLNSYGFSELQQDRTILITKMEKINGENAQISFDKKLNQWVIGSKNVTLICENENDIQTNWQEKDTRINRYRYAIKIATAWLQFLKQQKNVEEIKTLLESYTLIGEYCGNEDYQHLVKYQTTQLKFYALVPKTNYSNTSVTCVHPELAFQKLKSLNLICANSQTYLSNNYEDFKYQLVKIALDVSVSTIQEQGEGCVLYFYEQLEESQSQEDQNCISLIKLKTLDYRFKRKIREKMKMIINNNTNVQDVIDKYQKEVEQLLREVNQLTKHPLLVDLQLDLAKRCFSSVSFNKIKTDQNFKYFCINVVSNKFVEFLEEVKNANENENPFETLFSRARN